MNGRAEHVERVPVALLVNFGSYKFERRTVTLST